MNPVFSIIIPVYNVEPYLAECLDSVLTQDFDSYEVICINDGSTDRSFDILNKYVAQYTQIKVLTQTNQGLSAARNRGIAEASGEYLLFLDSDDSINPHTLKDLSDLITEEKPDIVAFNSELYSEIENNTRPNLSFNHTDKAIYKSGMDYFEYFVKSRTWGPSAVCFYLFKKELLLINKLQFPVGLLHEDELFMPQALYYSRKLVTFPEIVYVYRINAASITQTPKEKNFLDKLNIAEQLYTFFLERKVKDEYVNRSIYNLLLSGINGLIKRKESREKITKQIRVLIIKNANTRKEKFVAILIRINDDLYQFYRLLKNKL